MSFGLLKHFKETKKTNPQKLISHHVQHLILGQDLSAILKLIEIRKRYPGESIKLISPRPLTKEFLFETYQMGVSSLRSSDRVQEIYKNYHQAKIIPQKLEAHFYKDGKFHEFGGRARPMGLLPKEDFFVQKGFRVDLGSFFDAKDWEDLNDILTANSEVKMFDSIEKTNPDDLINKNEWVVTCRDYSQSSCENLYITLPPKKFVSLLSHKERFTKELIELGAVSDSLSGISVSWRLKKEIFPEERTLFIPQSMTHEWGHFILEFENVDLEKKEQLCHVLILINEEASQSEELAVKIKLAKRVIDRVFPDFEKFITKEFIRYDEDMFLSPPMPSLLEQLSFDFPSLNFLPRMF